MQGSSRRYANILQHSLHPILISLQLWGEDLSNPIGIAAGFDKDGEAIDGMANFSRRERASLRRVTTPQVSMAWDSAG